MPPSGIKWSAPVLIRRDGADLVVTIPKPAAEALRAAPGDVLNFTELPDGSIEVWTVKKSTYASLDDMRKRAQEMTLEIQASAAPLELLAADSRQPENRITEHPVWKAALAGELPKAALKRLLLAFYPALAGRGRYAFAAKVSQLDPQDGKELFLQLYDALKQPEADADAGWRRALAALGCTERELDDALANPSAEAVDLVDVIREHGLRSSPVEAAAIAYMLERHLPKLWGRLADSLRKHYGVKATRSPISATRRAAAPRSRNGWRTWSTPTWCRPSRTRCSRRGVPHARRCGPGRC